MLLKFLNERTSNVQGLTSGIPTDISNSYVENVWQLIRQDTQYNASPNVKSVREYLGRALKERTPSDFSNSAIEKFEEYMILFWRTIQILLSYPSHIIHLKNKYLMKIIIFL